MPECYYIIFWAKSSKFLKLEFSSIRKHTHYLFGLDKNWKREILNSEWTILAIYIFSHIYREGSVKFLRNIDLN